jgi:hypothetical protein
MNGLWELLWICLGTPGNPNEKPSSMRVFTAKISQPSRPQFSAPALGWENRISLARAKIGIARGFLAVSE